MALDLVALREAMAEQIRGNVAREINVYPYRPATPHPPCVIIERPRTEDYVDYGPTFGRPSCTVRFELWILTLPGVDTDGQRLVDEFLSVGTGQVNSFYDALSSDPTLGGVVADGLLVGVAVPEGRLRLDDGTLFDWATVAVTVHQRG